MNKKVPTKKVPTRKYSQRDLHRGRGRGRSK